MSSTTDLPVHVAPPSTRAETTEDVCEAAPCVLDQSGLPNPVTYPSMSNLRIKFDKRLMIPTNRFPYILHEIGMIK